MATIVGGINTSHIPAIGNAIAKGLQDEPYWKPFFDGYPPVREWLKEVRPDVAIVIYNDHGFGELRKYEKVHHFDRLIAVDLKNPAFDSLAAAYDIPYYHIGEKDDLRPALTKAFTLNCPALIEIESVQTFT